MRHLVSGLAPLLLTAAMLSLFLFLCGLRGFPPPMPDGVAFVPAAISFQDGKRLVNRWGSGLLAWIRGKEGVFQE